MDVLKTLTRGKEIPEPWPLELLKTLNPWPMDCLKNSDPWPIEI